MHQRLTAAVATMLLGAVALGGCGGGSDGDTATTGTTGEAQTGGTLEAYYTSTPDYMDPALSYTMEGWTVLWTAYTPLLTYRHAEGQEGAELIPGLAESLPEISEDGLTYRLRLRDGLRYSDGTPVKASDFEHTIKRVLNLESGGSGFFLGIDGAAEYVERGRANADIPGIEADDETGEITIRLTEPNGSFSNVLAMNFAGLVPGDTPMRNLSDDPPPGVGPFEITRSEPNRGFTLTRNERFPEIPGVAPAKLDEIDFEIVGNQQRQISDVLRSEVDWVFDPPPADQIATVREEAEGRYGEFTTNSTYFFFLNHDLAPFDDQRVREAVNVALDKRALARLFGGLLEPSCNFLPPGMPGRAEIEPCPWGDPSAAPDLERARSLIAEAGAEGTEVTVYGNDQAPSRPVVEYLADQLQQIGLDAKVRIVPGTAYFPTIMSAKTKAQIGFANWFQDYPHPSNFATAVDGAVIAPANNPNFGNVDDPELNALIEEANRIGDLDDAVDEYAEMDRLVVERAHVAPYGHQKLTKLVSERVDFDSLVAHPVYQVDLTQIALK